MDYTKINYSQYQSWEAVTLPNGTVLYLVPGTGYAYDPFLSAQKGRPVLWDNPKTTLEQKQIAQKQQDEAIKAQQYASSPLGQIAPVAAAVTGPIAANALVDHFWPKAPGLAEQATAELAKAKTAEILARSQGVAPSTAAQTFTNGIGGIQQVIPVDTSIAGVPSTFSVGADATGAAPGSFSVGADGTGQLSLGANTSLDSTLPGAGASLANSGGMLSGIAPAGSDFAAMGTLGQAATGVGGILGAYNLAHNWGHEGKIGGTMNGMATGAAIGSFIPGIPGVGTVIGGGIGALLGFGSSFLDRKAVKQYEQERLQNLVGLKSNSLNAFLGKAPGGQLQDLTDAEIKTANPTQLWGSYGMLNTFGNDYFTKMNEFQRFAATKAALDAGLLNSNHGDTMVTDPERLKQLLPDAYKNKAYLDAYNLWKNGKTTAAPTATHPGGANTPAPQVPAPTRPTNVPATTTTPAQAPKNNAGPKAKIVTPQGLRDPDEMGRALANRINSRV